MTLTKMTFHESLPSRKSFPMGVPKAMDTASRLYTCAAFRMCGVEWNHVLVTFDGEYTHVYLAHGWTDKGPELEGLPGDKAQYRKALKHAFDGLCDVVEVVS